MSKNSEFMTRINRMPAGTHLFRHDKKEKLMWRGTIQLEDGIIGPIDRPDLGVVCEHLLILYRRENNDTN